VVWYISSHPGSVTAAVVPGVSGRGRPIITGSTLNRFKAFFLKNRVPLLLFGVSAIVLGLFSWNWILSPSPHFHFTDLANSFLSGRLDTETPRHHRGERQRPEDPAGYKAAIDRHLTGPGGKAIGWNDWASVRRIKLTDGQEVRGVFPWADTDGSRKNEFHALDGTVRIIDPKLDIARDCGSGGSPCDSKDWYVSFPPFPSVLLVPLVAVFGYNINDVLLTVLNGAMNCMLIFLLLELLVSRKLSTRSRRENVILAILFTFGTVHFFSAIRGQVWFSALILGVSINILYIVCAIGARRPFLAGLAIACGMATRTPIAFASVFFALEIFRDGQNMRWPGFKYILRKVIPFAVPILAGGVLLMLMNYFRFDNPFEFGHSFLADGTRNSIRNHGLFSMWFAKDNLGAMLTNPPVIDGNSPFIHITRHGLGLLWTSPFLLMVLWPRVRNAFVRNLALTAVVIMVILSMYQNTGWAQFSYRFGLDFLPYVILMIAAGGREFSKVFLGAGAFSILMNVFGALSYDRMGMFFYD